MSQQILGLLAFFCLCPQNLLIAPEPSGAFFLSILPNFKKNRILALLHILPFFPISKTAYSGLFWIINLGACMDKENVTADVFNRKEAAKYLRICLTTLDRLDIPKIRIRKKVFYKPDVLDKWLDEQSGKKKGKK